MARFLSIVPRKAALIAAIPGVCVVVLIAVAAIACGESDLDQPSPRDGSSNATATPSPAGPAQPNANDPPTGFYPTTQRSSVRELDRFLEAFFAADAAALFQLTRTRESPCVLERSLNNQGAPICRAGMEAGTPIRGMGYTHCEGVFIPDELLEGLFKGLANEGLYLYAAFAPAEPKLPYLSADTGFLVLLGNALDVSPLLAFTLDRDGHVIGIEWQCGSFEPEYFRNGQFHLRPLAPAVGVPIQ